jgi:hypothetical protein
VILTCQPSPSEPVYRVAPWALPVTPHLVHDAGAFQLGIGVTLLLGTVWHDGLALVLTGMLVANTIHMINHAVDLSLGGGHAATAGGPGRADRDRAETSWAAAPQRRRQCCVQPVELAAQHGPRP